MADGLGVKDPARFDCRGTLNFGKDCIIDINVVFEGNNELGKDFKYFCNRVGLEIRLTNQGYRIAPLPASDTLALPHSNVGFFSAVVIGIK